MNITGIIPEISKVFNTQNTFETQQQFGRSLSQFIWKEKRNRRLLYTALIGTIIQFVVFKYFYPFADFFGDSYSYIFAAQENLDINIWPIGYSKFLRLFHFFTHSDTTLVAFQYFFLELSALYFFFTILYFYNPVRTNRNILFIFLFFNPLFIYLSNYVNSDPIFAALSLCWLTQLLWIIQCPTLSQIFIQAVLLFACFTVRNNAYYYPLITILSFALSRQHLWRKVTGALLSIALIIPFVIHTRNAAYKMTGTRQFSLATGWQVANNALYMYDKIQVDSTKLPSDECRKLDRISRQFFKSIPQGFKYRYYLAAYVGNYFIRQPESPLKQYIREQYTITDDYSLVVDWGKASAVFAEYGNYLIKHYPIAYARHYMLLNAKNYFLPPLEKLNIYNLGLDEVPIIAQDWFDYKTPDVLTVSKNIQGYILYVFPLLFLIANVYFIGNVGWFLARNNFLKADGALNRALLLNSSFLLINFCFTVFATINVFRYQVVPMIVCVVSLLLLMEWLGKKKTLIKQTDRAVEENKMNFELA